MRRTGAYAARPRFFVYIGGSVCRPRSRAIDPGTIRTTAPRSCRDPWLVGFHRVSFRFVSFRFVSVSHTRCDTRETAIIPPLFSTLESRGFSWCLAVERSAIDEDWKHAWKAAHRSRALSLSLSPGRRDVSARFRRILGYLGIARTRVQCLDN